MHPEKLRYNLAGVGINRQLPVGHDFRVIRSGYALADDAVGHWGNTFGMARKLQPTRGDRWGVVLQEDGTSGGTQLESIDCKKAEQRLVVGRSLIEQVLSGCSIGFDVAVLAVAIIQYKHFEKGTFQTLILQAAQSKLVTRPAGHCEENGRSHASQTLAKMCNTSRF